MTQALRLPEGPFEALRTEMARLHAAGFDLLPLRDKSPAVKGWDKRRLTLGQVLGPMYRAGSSVYGIRLSNLAVLDCDVFDPALIARLEERFGKSTVHVRTPRGLHLYYAAPVPVQLNLKGEGLPVDVKSGPSSYVVGPGSVRPDGGTYTTVKGALGDLLTPLRVSPAPPVTPETERHHRLIQEAIGMVAYVDGPEELAGNLAFIRDTQFANPETVPDREIERVAAWAWRKRLDNSLFAGRNSSFRFDRAALDRLKGLPNASDAIALLAILTDLHGHNPAKPFALVWRSMKDAGHTDLTRRRFLAARNTLVSTGLLALAGRHRAGHRHQRFRLVRALPTGGREAGEEGLSLTYGGQFRTSSATTVGCGGSGSAEASSRKGAGAVYREGGE
jgi:hypothetical protein